MKKKIISLLLAISMATSILPMMVFAEEETTFICDDNLTQETNDYFEDTQSGIVSDGSEYIVTDITYDSDTTFNVMYHAETDCYIKATMTDDLTGNVISEKTVDASSEIENVLIEFDVSNVPEYYTISAVLSDGTNNLCDVYDFEEKGYIWHEFMSMDINDPRLAGQTVVDFGKNHSGGKENFGVVNENVVVITVDSIEDVEIDENEDETAALFNIGTTVDEAYTVKRSETDGEIDNIKKGDKVLILPQDNVYDIRTFIVDDMDVDEVSLFDDSDDEITLITDIDTETTVEDYFDYIRIDTYIEATEQDMIPNTSDESLEWEDEDAELFADFNLVDKGVEKSKTFTKTFGSGKLTDTLTAKAGVHLTVVAVASASCKWWGIVPYDIKTKLTFKIKADANLNVTNVFGIRLSKNASISGEPQVGSIPIASIGIADISIPVNIVYSFSAGASVNFTTTQTAGMSITFNFNGSSGSFNKSTKTPTSGYNIAIEGKISAKLGVRIGISVSVGKELNLKFVKLAAKAKADISGEVGIKITGTVASVADSNTMSHLCLFCLNGDASLYASADVSAKYKKGGDGWKTLYSKNLGTASHNIKTFYCSKWSDGWHYGSGNCTNKSYLAKFTVKSGKKALSGVDVYEGTKKLGTTNSKGVYSTKLKNGKHTIKFKKKGYSTKSLTVNISSGTVSKDVSMSKSGGANETYYTMDDLVGLTDDEFNEFITDSEVVANTIFRIQNAEDLAALSDFVNNSGKTTSGLRFVLNNSEGTIDLSNTTWTPIGTATAPFKGELDGNKFTLTGLTVSGNNDYSGLFGCVDDAKIFDLGIENANISGGNYVGILAGVASNSSDIYDCYTTGTITGNNNVGGIVGSLSESKLINSYNMATITANDSVGGIAGAMSHTPEKGQISNCYNAGIITAQNNVGGVTGNMTFVDNTDNTATDEEEKAAIVGVRYCYFVNTTAESAIGKADDNNTVIAYPITESQAVGNSGELISEDEGYAFTYSLLDSLNAWYETFGKNSTDGETETSDEDGLIIAAEDNYNQWYADEAMINNGYPIFESKGTAYELTVDYVYEDGTEAKPPVTLYVEAGQQYDVDSYIIPGYYTIDIEYSGIMPESDLNYRVIYYKETEYADTVSNLYANYQSTGVEAISGKIYNVETVSDLQALSDYTNAGGKTEGVIFKQSAVIDMNGSTISPIGNKEKPFKGTYNGQGIEVTALTMDTKADYSGLFGYTDGAILENINVSQSTISGNDYIGAIVGYAKNSKLNYCYNTSTAVNGSNCVGGVIGYADQTTIDRTENAGTVNADMYVGGICGKAEQSGATNSYNTSIICGNSYIGGIFGMSEKASLMNNYNNGAIGSADSIFTGGIAGNASDTVVENNYNSGSVTGQSNSNSIIGNSAELDANYNLTSDTDMNNIVESLNSWVNNRCSSDYNVWLMDDESEYPILGFEYEGWLNNLNINSSTISFEYDKNSHHEATFYVAQYDQNGMLIHCDIVEDSGEVSIPTMTNAKQVKFMIWSEDMLPLENVISQNIK